jgi:UDP:flavonoid glycosyltransferase YjiC (YdhE family)
VRILVTFTGGRGHLEPLLPIAVAARVAGHAVAVAGRASVLPAAEALGFETFATGDRERQPERTPLLPVDLEKEERDLREGFAVHHAREHAPAVGAVCELWGPDVLVCDEVDFGSMVTAERRGIPHASVVTLAAGSLLRADLLAEPLDTVRAEHGLPPDPELRMPSRHLVLSPVPPSFRDPAFPPPATLRAFRSGEPARAAEATDPPTLYFTLGTEFNLESGDLFERVLAGLGELPVEVVATVGSELDPAVLGPQPDTIRVERYVPQHSILPRASAVVCHGGSGSVLGALAHGVPLVLLPMGADQPQNADRCAALGVGIVLDVIAATPEDVRGAVSAVLSEPSYRAAAERIRDEIAALPGPEHAVALLERLAVEARPS